MSRTLKGGKKGYFININRKIKADAKRKRKTLSKEDNPRALRLGSADVYDYI
jgi:hypothetical protein